MSIVLRVAELTSTPTILRDRLGMAWCAERAGAVYRAADNEMIVEVEATQAATVVDVKGRIIGHFGFDCSRCAEPSVLAIEESFEHHFVGPGQLDAGEETDGFDADPDVSEHDGVSIELDDLAIELALVALPVVPLCSEDCKGLCPQCGTNLNRETCSCQPARDSLPTWDKLRAFKLVDKDERN